jgi:hypothetical protein
MLNNDGITVHDAGAAIRYGHSICGWLGSNYTPVQVVTQVYVDTASCSKRDAVNYTLDAVGNFCPQCLSSFANPTQPVDSA